MPLGEGSPCAWVLHPQAGAGVEEVGLALGKADGDLLTVDEAGGVGRLDAEREQAALEVQVAGGVRAGALGVLDRQLEDGGGGVGHGAGGGEMLGTHADDHLGAFLGAGEKP